MIYINLVISFFGLLTAIWGWLFTIKHIQILRIKGYAELSTWRSFILILVILLISTFEFIVFSMSLSQLIFSILEMFNFKSMIAISNDYFFSMFELVNKKFTLLSIVIIIFVGLFLKIFVSRIPYKEVQKYDALKKPKWLGFAIYFCFTCPVLALFLFSINVFWPGKIYPKVEDNTKFFTLMGLFTLGLILQRYKTLYQRQISLNDLVLLKDYVVYLRSFGLDYLPFAKASIWNKDEFGDFVNGYLGITRRTELSFESYFGYQINHNLGKFICFGNPTNRTLKEGVNSLYPKSKEWQNLFYSAISNCKIILMQIGNSKTIKFELSAIVATGNLSKLCIFTEPYDTQIQESLKSKIRKWVVSSQKLTWREIEKIIKDCDIIIDFTLSPGSVIVFISQPKKAILLKAGCVLPSQYISVVKKYFLTDTVVT